MAIRKRGSGWQVYWNEPGTRTRRSRMFSGPDAKAQAQAFDLEVKRTRIVDPDSLVQTEAPSAGPRNLSMIEVLDQYLVAKASENNPEYIKGESYSLQAWVVPVVGSVPVDQLTRSHIHAVIEAGRKRGLAGSTINRRLNVIRAALRWAEDRQIIEANPLSRMPKASERKPAITAPTEAEVMAIMGVAPDHLKRAVALAWWTGIRPGRAELLALLWSHVDRDLTWIRVPCADKGSGPWRPVPIHASLREFLAEWRAADEELAVPWIVHYRGRPMITLKKAWAKAVNDAGIDRPIRQYDLRHGFVSRALDQGLDPGTIAAITGHSVDTMLRHYQHVRLPAMQRAMEDLDGTRPWHTSGRKMAKNGTQEKNKIQ